MAENELRCNNIRGCRKELAAEGKAVVTTCSLDCATADFSEARICPACGTALTEQDDVVVVTLNPSNDYKTSILSGLSPSIIMEICTRSLSAFQGMVLTRAQDRLAYAEREREMATGELNLAISKLQVTEKSLEVEKRRNKELSETSRVKEREYAKLKSQYDKIRRKVLLSGPNAELAADNRLNCNSCHARAGSMITMGENFYPSRPIKTPVEGQTSGPFHPSPAVNVQNNQAESRMRASLRFGPARSNGDVPNLSHSSNGGFVQNEHGGPRQRLSSLQPGSSHKRTGANAGLEGSSGGSWEGGPSGGGRATQAQRGPQPDFPSQAGRRF